MSALASLPTARTVPLPLASVNRLLPVTTRGERLRSFLVAQTGGRRGWQKKLVEASGVKRQTISKWTNPRFDGYPEPETMAALAEALGVRLWQVYAAMDGDAPAVVLDDRTVAAVQALIEATLAERLGPRRSPHE